MAYTSMAPPSPLRGIPTAHWTSGSRQSRSRCAHLDLAFECSSCKCFHNCPCWLCLHLLLHTEHHPHTGLGCWLCPCLDAHKAWDRKDAGLLHLLGSDGCKSRSPESTPLPSSHAPRQSISP